MRVNRRTLAALALVVSTIVAGCGGYSSPTGNNSPGNNSPGVGNSTPAGGGGGPAYP